MFSAFFNSWKIPELRQRIIWTLGIVIVVRIGSNIPCPGVNPTELTKFIQDVQGGGGVLGLANLFTGGALQKCAVFGLGVMPYVTASIIMMMLQAVIPALERMRQEGESGRARLIQYGRVLTLGVCLIQGFALARAFEYPEKYRLFGEFKGTLVANPGLPFELLTVMTIMAGTILLMWLGEQISERGIGNGISIIITVGIVDQLPAAIGETWRLFFPPAGAEARFNILHALLLLTMLGAVIAGVIAITQARRKIAVQYARRIVGNKMLQGGQQFMPLPVNYSGVMPIIFAQAIMQIPFWLFRFSQAPAMQKAARLFSDGWVYMALYGLMILAFSYFWVAIQFNPLEIADNLKKYGGYVPGVRPGKPTAEYLNFTMTRITLAGSVFLTIIAVIPIVLSQNLGIPPLSASFFGGTSLLITVGVMLDTMRQVESHLIMRHYDGFLRKGRLRGRR